uniref:NADH-ubiquinone oxidoreductase chain 3 n=1 Tax=Cassida sp. EMHAU-15090501 TaxID=2480058 RepID=A0A3G3C791_9CUCU|nr:NADH dehydrogenase subunit 3 [Cassida sp. EMHAU-15090501]
MKTLMLLLTLNIMVIMLMLTLLNILSKKSFYDKEKNSPFECGFDPKSNSRSPFSLQFFLIAIIFLVFDVEIILLMPMVKIIENSSIIQLIMSSNSFLMILILGFLHEWKQGALKWLK